MRRIMLVFSVVCATAQVGHAQRAPAKKQVAAPKQDPAKSKLVRNPKWVPKPGDRAEVYFDDTPALADNFAYAEYEKYGRAKDRVGIEKLAASGVIAKLPKGVHVLVIHASRPEQAAPGSRVISDESFYNSLLTASAARKDTTVYPLEVRILDGPLKDQVRWVPEDFIAEMVPAPPPSQAPGRGRAKPRSKTFNTDTPAFRASRDYRNARKLEEEGKKQEAIEAYRQLSKSTFPEGRLATARLKALTGK